MRSTRVRSRPSPSFQRPSRPGTRISAIGVARRLTLFLAAAILFSASGARAAERRLLALLTDYGTTDFYVAALKGVIFTADPGARVVDLTHEVPAFDIREGAFLLAESTREFPPGVVFVGIVDPGVGTARKPIAIRTRDGSFFVGPDNGLLIDAARERGIDEVREIANSAYMRRGARSSTFHGRDIFGPAAAHLARGDAYGPIGPPRERWVELPHAAAAAKPGRATGEVVHVDRYGNVITNLTIREAGRAGLKKGDRVRAALGSRRIEARFTTTYADAGRGENVLVAGSTGRLELAVSYGNLAARIGTHAGDRVTLEPAGARR